MAEIAPIPQKTSGPKDVIFIGKKPIMTYAMAALKTPFLRSGKEHLPQRWIEVNPAPHDALQDAIEQGVLFCNMLQEHTRR